MIDEIVRDWYDEDDDPSRPVPNLRIKPVDPALLAKQYYDDWMASENQPKLDALRRVYDEKVPYTPPSDIPKSGPETMPRTPGNWTPVLPYSPAQPQEILRRPQRIDWEQPDKYPSWNLTPDEIGSGKIIPLPDYPNSPHQIVPLPDNPNLPHQFVPLPYRPDARPELDWGLGPDERQNRTPYGNVQRSSLSLYSSSLPQNSNDNLPYGMVDPAVAQAQDEYDRRVKYGCADPAVLQAQKTQNSAISNTYGIMTDALVQKALSQVGNHEELIVDKDGKPIRDKDGNLQGTNKNIYGDWYKLDEVPWCAEFVNWCVHNCGISPDLVPNKRYVNSKGVACESTGAYKQWYKDNNRYQKNDQKTPPHAGDIVILNDSAHIGIVVGYDPKTKCVYTVEGNAGQYVSLNSYPLDDPYIVGYCLNGGSSYGNIPTSASAGVGQTVT